MVFQVSGQIENRQGGNTNTGTRQEQSTQRKEAIIDSINVFYYTLDNIDKLDTFKAPVLPKYFQQYDPARQRDFDYGTLGNVGSSAYPMAFKVDFNMERDIGFHQYDLYKKKKEDLRFFDVKTPLAIVNASIGESQNDLIAGAFFTRSFKNNVNWVIDYDRISQNGLYNNQAAKQTSLASTFAYKPENSRISLFISFAVNNAVEQINGGVVNLLQLEDPDFALRPSVSVETTDAESRLQQSEISFNAFYNLMPDSLESDFQNYIQYETNYDSYFFRFSDEGVTSDSAFYGIFYTDPRGIRHYQEGYNLKNSASFVSAYGNIYRFKTGISHSINRISLSDTNVNFQDLFVHFNGQVNIGKRLSIGGEAFYGLFNAANTFGVNALANLSLTKKSGFNFGFRNMRTRPTILEEVLVMNESELWKNDFAYPITQTLSTEFYHKKYKFKAGFKLNTIFNHIYYNEEALPVQLDNVYAISLLYLGKDIRFKWLLLENFLFLQNQSQYVHNVPTAFTKNSIAFQGYVFQKQMLLKAGLDFRYIVFNYLPEYAPVTGQFYLNNTVENSIYNSPFPLIDAQITFKVSTLTAFVKYENLLSLITSDLEFLVIDYPQYDPRFRLGITWNLWN